MGRYLACLFNRKIIAKNIVKGSKDYESSLIVDCFRTMLCLWVNMIPKNVIFIVVMNFIVNVEIKPQVL